MKALALALLLLPFCLRAEEGYLPKVKVTPLEMAVTDAAGQPIKYPGTDQPEVRALIVEIPPGAQTGWHRHPYPCYAYMLEGELEVEIEGGRKNRIKAGEASVEVVNLWHNGTNVGDKPAKLVLFVTGERGKPFTTRSE